MGSKPMVFDGFWGALVGFEMFVVVFVGVFGVFCWQVFVDRRPLVGFKGLGCLLLGFAMFLVIDFIVFGCVLVGFCMGF